MKKKKSETQKNQENTEIEQDGEVELLPAVISEKGGETKLPEVISEEVGEANLPAIISEESGETPPPEIIKPRGDKILTPTQKRIRTVIRWVLIHIGITLMSISVYFFQTPNNFTLGGVAGIAILLTQFIPLSQAVLMAIINVLLLIVGFIILGKGCSLRTLYCSLLYTGIIWLFEYLVPLDKPITDQPMLEMVYAILLFGVGGALIFNCGASSGGTDIIALILKKFTHINVGVALMIIDLIVVGVSIFAFDSITTALYSFMGLFARTFILDGIIESITKTKYITIITTKPEEIGQYILEVIKHGYTKYDAEGGYTGEQKKVLITICKRSEALKLKMRVKQMDPESFVIITDANEIIGKGFGGTL